MPVHLLLAIVSATVITSCTHHMTLQQCMSMNWQKAGYDDGLMGKKQRDLSQVLHDCAAYNVTVDPKRYQAGWLLGSQLYCHPDETLGYAEGFAGKNKATIMMRETYCQNAQLPLDIKQYDQGYQKGLAAFCTFENGRNLAKLGEKKPKVCEGRAAIAFQQGFTLGKEEFCNHGPSAFAFGKAAKAYPPICHPEHYHHFKQEYDRGLALHKQLVTLVSRLANLQNKIEEVARNNHFKLGADGSYQLDEDSPQAKQALHELQTQQKIAYDLERDIFQLKTTV